MNIEQNELQNLVAESMAERLLGDGEIEKAVHGEILKRTSQYFSDNIKAIADKVLSDEMERVLREKIVPVDIYGEKCGEPTTIRATIAVRAREFWDVKVDNEGKASTGWSVTPRHAWLLKRVAREEFENAVKENAGEIVEQFKAAMKADSQKFVTDHIDKLFKTR